jgi:NADH-quinone oxidoreductase subunit G
MSFSDVMLPISPFTETPFINAEGRIPSFHAVVKPMGNVLHASVVLALLVCQGFNFESSTMC